MTLDIKNAPNPAEKPAGTVTSHASSCALPSKQEATEMARRLTGALKENHRLSIKHGQSLSLIARIFDCASSNALVARIDAAEKATPATRLPSGRLPAAKQPGAGAIPDAAQEASTLKQALEALDYIEQQLNAFKKDWLSNVGLDVALEQAQNVLRTAGILVDEPTSTSSRPSDAGRDELKDHAPLRVGDRVIDLVGGLREGIIEDLYVNRHDNPNGETLAVVRFGGQGENDDDVPDDQEAGQDPREWDRDNEDEDADLDEEVYADRSLHEIRRAPNRRMRTWDVNVRAIVSGDLDYLRDVELPDCWEIYDFDEDDAEESAVMRCDTVVTVQARSAREAVKSAIDKAPSLGVRYDQSWVKLWVDEDIDVVEGPTD